VFTRRGDPFRGGPGWAVGDLGNRPGRLNRARRNMIEGHVIDLTHEGEILETTLDGRKIRIKNPTQKK